MKTTKKVMIALAVAALVAPTLESCKKGENDPGLSLRSRKGRVAGEWTVKSWEYKSTSTSNTTETQTTSPSSLSDGTDTYSSNNTETVSFDGTNFKHSETWSYTNNNVTTTNDTTYTGTGEIKYTFEKDGTFSMTHNAKYTRIVTTTPYTGATQVQTWNFDYTTTRTGTWNFTSGIGKETKNKDGLVLTYVTEEQKNTVNYKSDFTFNNTTTTTTTVTTSNNKSTFDTNEIHENWYLDRLANKEMVAKVSGKTTRNIDNKTVTTAPSYTQTVTEVGTETENYSIDINLSQE
ncbi:MAG: hypothetical protein ACK4IK_12460 [Bacteroidia bacterium]